MSVAGGLALASRLRFSNHAPQQLAIGLTLHQQQTIGSVSDFRGASEEVLAEGWEVVVAMGVAL